MLAELEKYAAENKQRTIIAEQSLYSLQLIQRLIEGSDGKVWVPANKMNQTWAGLARFKDKKDLYFGLEWTQTLGWREFGGKVLESLGWMSLENVEILK